MSAFALRLIACIAMLIDHIGYSYGIMSFRIVGRLAFPIFLFLIYNGYQHTSNKWKYALRLAVFAILSQIPFSLFSYNEVFRTNGNVFFTLFICLICFWTSDLMSKNRILKWFCLIPWIMAFGLYYFGLIRSDYGAKAVLLALSIFLFYGEALWKRILLVCSAACSVFYSFALSCLIALKDLIMGDPIMLSVPNQWASLQAFSLFAFVFIFSYNGKKGGISCSKLGSKCIQFGFYLFYPVHMLILWLIRVLFS